MPLHRARLLTSAAVLAAVLSACSATGAAQTSPSGSSASPKASGGDDVKAAREQGLASACAKTYLALSSAELDSRQVVNARGCGHEVYVRPSDLERLEPGAGWDTDTGQVNAVVRSVDLLPAGSCAAPPVDIAPVVGAQVVELVAFQPTAHGGWQDVVVLTTPQDARALYEGRVARAQCAEPQAARQEITAMMGSQVAADKDVRDIAVVGSRRVDGGADWTVFVHEDPTTSFPPAYVAAARGVYYTEMALPEGSVLGGALTTRGRQIVETVLARLGT